MSEDVVLAKVAEIVEEALAQTMWLITRSPTTPVAEKRDWCVAVSAQAHDLAVALGAAPNAPVGAPWDTLAALEPGLAPATGADAARAIVPLPLSVPETNDKDAMPRLIGRLVPALTTLCTVAQAAAAEWDSEGKRGGRSIDREKHFLIEYLFIVYECLFSKKPIVFVRASININNKNGHAPLNMPSEHG